MSSVLARFQLSEVKRIAYSIITPDGKQEMSEAVNIQLYAVKGEPFGSATPQGTISALIVNTAAAKVFQDAAMGTEFDVLMTPREKNDG